MTDPADPEFLRCLPIVLQFEGGKVDDKDDPGGRTNQGITQHTFDRACDAWGVPRRDVFTITPSEVSGIYAEDYWVPSGAYALGWPMNLLVFDSAVQHGVARAKRWMMRYDTPKAFLDGRQQFYEDIIASHPVQAKYRKGWFHRVDVLRQLST